MKILILCGGNSNEKDISVRSGRGVAAAVTSNMYDVVIADPADKNFDLKKLTKDIDLVLPILHGKGGEDGTIQEQIEALHIPYLGSGPEACKRSFNKASFKDEVIKNGFLTPKWQVVDKETFPLSELRLKPYVLKPIEGGSSIDLYMVRDPKQQIPNLDSVFKQYDKMLLEEYIEGHIVTVGVIDKTVLPLILVIPPKGEEFDYKNKYNGRSQEIVSPTQIPIKVQKRAQEITLAIHRIIGCRHLSRTDMIISSDGSIYVLEINTMPGLTQYSSIPIAARAIGLNMQQLVEELINLVKNGAG